MKNKKGLNEAEMIQVKAFLAAQAVLATPRKDQGTCVLGEGIECYYMAPRKRLPTKQMLIYNNWTQGDQPEVFNKMLEAARKQFPHLADFLHYNCGYMD